MLSIKLEKSAYSARGFEASLKKWEEKWQSHPQSSHLPSSHHSPLAADAISLLNSAYYHLHGSRQLRQMKRVLCEALTIYGRMMTVLSSMPPSYPVLTVLSFERPSRSASMRGWGSRI